MSKSGSDNLLNRDPIQTHRGITRLHRDTIVEIIEF